jgi:hypothetical protein
VFDIRRILLVCLAAACILGASTGSAGAITPPTPSFSFTYQSWSPSEQVQLESWLNPNGSVMKTIKEVAGPPERNLAITVVKEDSGNAGEYDSYEHKVILTSLQLSVLDHELMHATRDGWTLSDSLWEEGLARAGEKEVMRLLALKGITEAGYDTNHEYGYDEYYENNNTPTVGVPYGDIYIDPALTLLRYEQAGYAFSKVLMENPQFIAEFNAKVFTHPNGNLSQTELIATANEVQPEVEGLPFPEWEQEQAIFDTNQQPGCYLFERSNQFTVDFYCTDQYGNVTMQEGATITLKIQGPYKELVFKGSGISTSYGLVGFEPPLTATTGRIKMVATAKSPEGGSAKATFYRQSGNAEGVFGVITNATTGEVNFHSPSGQFTPFSVPVTNGAFVAPTLTSVRGQVVAEFRSPRLSAVRTFDKDAAPYSLVITAHKAKKSKS